MPPIEKISEEIRNRLQIWRILIKESYESLLVAEELWQMATKNKAYEIYSRPYVIAGKNKHYNFCHTAMSATFAQVVVCFGNIYGPGAGGIGFAKNNNEQCRLFINEMEVSVLDQLSISRVELEDFKIKLLDYRNQQVAHFDGSKAEFTVKPNGWVTTHKMPLAHFNQVEQVKVQSIIKAMYLHIENYFTAVT